MKLSNTSKECLEETCLWRHLEEGTASGLIEAWRLAGKMSVKDIRLRSEIDNGTYLHHLVVQSGQLTNRKLLPLVVCLVYRLAHQGVLVNARNQHGNTALHLSCIKPRCSSLSMHLIRIGVDPCIPNNKDCYVVYEYRHHVTYLSKGNTCARTGIWDAVFREDLTTTETLLKSWTRVDVYRNKTLLKLAEDSTNYKMCRLLEKYRDTNELVCAAHACDVEAVTSLLLRGNVDLKQKDESCQVNKPILVSLRELGNISKHVVAVILQHDPDESQCILYQEQLLLIDTMFENSEFYMQLDKNTNEGYMAALDLIQDYNPRDKNMSMDVHLTSKRLETKGWTYLHLVVNCYMKAKFRDWESSNILLRLIYRLALAGIDIDARDHMGRTVLIHVAMNTEDKRYPPDQDLLTHLLRIGCDSSLAHRDGDAVFTDTYNDKGKLVYNKKYRERDLPGLWPAVENGDIKLAERWLKTWSRVKAKKTDGRHVIDLSMAKDKDIGVACSPMTRLLTSYAEVNEFVCATLACDLDRMMSIVALGNGQQKTNTVDHYYDISNKKRMNSIGDVAQRFISAEFIQRPLLVLALEICTPQVIDFLLRFGANPAHQYNEKEPSGPVAFYAFLPHISNEHACVLAKHVDLELRDSFGATMLHSAIRKERNDPAKLTVIDILLERGADVSSRDNQGKTPRDYCVYEEDVGRVHESSGESDSDSDVDSDNDVGGDTEGQTLPEVGAKSTSASMKRTPTSRSQLRSFTLVPATTSVASRSRHVSTAIAGDSFEKSTTSMSISRNAKSRKGESLAVDESRADLQRSTSRMSEHEVEHEFEITGLLLAQIIDDHILELVYTDQAYMIESLVVNGYNHILDIQGSKRHKNARQICEQKLFKDTMVVLDSIPMYEKNIAILHEAAKTGDLRTLSKLAGEKRCAFGRDLHGRTILHNAVLYVQPAVVNFIVEQFPALINLPDSLKRTALHYCVCIENRHLMWPTLQAGDADPNNVDANYLSVYDYIRDMEHPETLMKRAKFNPSIYRPSIEIKKLQELSSKKLEGKCDAA